MHTLLIISHQT